MIRYYFINYGIDHYHLFDSKKFDTRKEAIKFIELLDKNKCYNITRLIFNNAKKLFVDKIDIIKKS